MSVTRVLLELDRDITGVDSAGNNHVLPKGAEISGELEIVEWDSPVGRDHPSPSYFAVSLRFCFNETNYEYHGHLSVWDLFVKNGEHTFSVLDFAKTSGPIEWQLDSRGDVTFFIDGKECTNSLKYVHALIEIMVLKEQVVTKCIFYDANIQHERTVFYSKPLGSILFKNYVRFFQHDGVITDYDLHGNNFVRIEVSSDN